MLARGLSQDTCNEVGAERLLGLHPNITSRRMARGILFTYLDGQEEIDLKFRTYSGDLLKFKKIEEAECSELLQDL